MEHNSQKSVFVLTVQCSSYMYVCSYVHTTTIKTSHLGEQVSISVKMQGHVIPCDSK